MLSCAETYRLPSSCHRKIYSLQDVASMVGFEIQCSNPLSRRTHQSKVEEDVVVN